MTPFDDEVLSGLARLHRHELPPHFEAEMCHWGVAASRNLDLESDEPSGDARNQSIRDLITRELSLYLCTEDPKYESLRAEGKNATTALVAMLGATVAAALGLPLAAATGCVAYVALAVAKLGAGVFCELYPPPTPVALDDSESD